MNALQQRRRGTWDVLETLRQEMDQMFHRFGGDLTPKAANGELAIWAPSVDVEETDKELVVRADLPGVDPKDVEVTVENEALILRGEKKEEFEDQKKNFHRMERFIGRFYREIPLPAGTEPEKVQATSAKGVLEVHIPKGEGYRPRKVPVTSKE